MTDGERPAAKKAAATKAPAKKAPARKAAGKNVATKKTPAKKAATKKAPAKKVAAKKAPAKKVAAKKVAATKGASAPATRPKKAPGKRTRVKKVRESVSGAGKRASRAVESKYFRRAKDRARKLVEDPGALERLAKESNRSEADRSGPFTAVVDDFKALIRLVVAYGRGQYREIPLDSLILVTAGLIYVVSPIDVIPDAIPVAGYADDALVIGYVIRSVRGELDAFREWERGR